MKVQRPMRVAAISFRGVFPREPPLKCDVQAGDGKNGVPGHIFLGPHAEGGRFGFKVAVRTTGAATPESAIQKLKQLTAAEIDTSVQGLADDDLADDDDATDRLPGSDDATDDAPLTVADLHAADHPRLSADAVAMLIDRRGGR